VRTLLKEWNAGSSRSLMLRIAAMVLLTEALSPRFTFSYTEIVDLNFLAASRSLRSPPLVAYQNAQFSATEKSPHLPALQHSGGSLFLR
jgi:hypothetical protein